MKELFATLANSVKIDPDDIGYEPTIKVANDTTISDIMGVVYLVAGMVAVLVIIVAGFIFVTSRGDQNNIARAKSAILYAVVGLVVIMMAFVITQFIIGSI
jgi:hypothetical protein